MTATRSSLNLFNKLPTVLINEIVSTLELNDLLIAACLNRKIQEIALSAIYSRIDKIHHIQNERIKEIFSRKLLRF